MESESPSRCGEAGVLLVAQLLRPGARRAVKFDVDLVRDVKLHAVKFDVDLVRDVKLHVELDRDGELDRGVRDVDLVLILHKIIK